MRDFLPADKAIRVGVATSIRSTFSSYGYREIETPVAEDLGRLQSGDDGDNGKLIFKILKRGLDPDAALAPLDAADLGLRFDLTVPLSRFYATHSAQLPEVFRSIQIAPVWRAERPQKGRYRQFMQCDIDVLGEPSNLAEVELITATTAAVDALGIDGVSVRINDRTVLFALLDDCGVEPVERSAVLIAVDKLDKIGVAGVADELRAGAGGARGADRLVGVLEAVIAAGGPVAESPDAGPRAGPTGPGNDEATFDATLGVLPPAAAKAGEALMAIRAALATAAPHVRLVADPTLVRGQGYYTGTIFELVHPSVSGSIAGGGRYDGMIGRLAGRDVPACGSSIGFERIIDLVDPQRFGAGRRRVAIVYDAAAEPGIVVGWQRRLIAADTDVRLVRRVRNQSRLLDELAREGFVAYLDLGSDAKAPEPDQPVPDLRPIRART